MSHVPATDVAQAFIRHENYESIEESVVSTQHIIETAKEQH
jgi:hypothetical protein